MKKRIKRGLESFQKRTYKEYEALYHKLETQQDPDILFIGCSDSRVSPEILLDADPGEVFVLRNIANSVPSIHDKETDTTTMSAIEYAVLVLEVEMIIVCGHSNCGGCSAALAGDRSLSKLPYTKHYLKPLKGLCEKVAAENGTDQEKAKRLEELNVLEQLRHLREYDFVRERIEEGRLDIEGWRYDIGEGTVERYDETADRFLPLDDLKQEEMSYSR
ncbi:MAG: carbonic anhydrase [Alkalibacterium sp.]